MVLRLAAFYMLPVDTHRSRNASADAWEFAGCDLFASPLFVVYCILNSE
jgi:hypothetical protein